LDLARADLKPEGVHVRQRKDSRDNITTWTPRLRASIDLALSLPRKVQYLNDAQAHVIPSRTGDRLGESTVQTAWQRLIHDALAKGLAQRFTVHDLKAKGIRTQSGLISSPPVVTVIRGC
jgi:integrase